MPWRNTAPMDQRTQFIADHLRETQTITERCDRYGVSRKTGDKWIDRYLRLGPAGRSARAGPIAPRIRPPTRSWPQSWRLAIGTPSGAARSCGRSSSGGTRGGPSRAARRSATS